MFVEEAEIYYILVEVTIYRNFKHYSIDLKNSNQKQKYYYSIPI